MLIEVYQLNYLVFQKKYFKFIVSNANSRQCHENEHEAVRPNFHCLLKTSTLHFRAYNSSFHISSLWRKKCQKYCFTSCFIYIIHTYISSCSISPGNSHFMLDLFELLLKAYPFVLQLLRPRHLKCWFSFIIRILTSPVLYQFGSSYFRKLELSALIRPC